MPPSTRHGLPPHNDSSYEKIMATIVFRYAWKYNSMSTETITYTITQSSPAGPHTAYARIVNSDPALPRPSQVQIVGIPYSLTSSGEVFTHDGFATLAMHQPTSQPGITPDHRILHGQAVGDSFLTDVQAVRRSASAILLCTSLLAFVLVWSWKRARGRIVLR